MTVGRKIAGVAVAAAVVYGAWVRPRLARWGATEEELAGPYPGAELVPGGKRCGAMAVTIDAPPDQVWPWLVQMGLGPRRLVFLGPPRQRRPPQCPGSPCPRR